MPRYEYVCDECEVTFDELLILQAEIAQYKDSHPCPSCKKMSRRNYVTEFGFAFKGGVRGTSGVHGNSGVHDLDYPTLDKAVARSSDAKWKENIAKQEAIQKARKESPSGVVSHTTSGEFKPASSEVVKKRDDAYAKMKS
jgi:putative FmdB family regulatory protein